MKALKQAGVAAGAVMGGVIGGTVSFVGKVIRQPEIDQLGENIMDSAILTGEIAGHAMSGAADVVSGTVKRDKAVIKAGGRDLKRAGVAVGKNLVTCRREAFLISSSQYPAKILKSGCHRVKRVV